MNNENENIPSTETLRIQYSAWEIMPFAEGREITRSIVTVFQLLPTRIFGGVPLFRCRCFRPTRTQANFLSLFYVPRYTLPQNLIGRQFWSILMRCVFVCLQLMLGAEKSNKPKANNWLLWLFASRLAKTKKPHPQPSQLKFSVRCPFDTINGGHHV